MRHRWLVLSVLLLAGCGGSADRVQQPRDPDSTLSANGISVHLPSGWTGRILIGASGRPVLHAASFPVEANDTDDGRLAREAIGINGMYLNVRDLGPGSEDRSLPLRLEPSDFAPAPVGPKSACCHIREARVDVESNGERFGVVAVSGSEAAPQAGYLDQLNDALSSLQLSTYRPEPVAPADASPIDAFGLHANVPPGWQGGIGRGQVHVGDGSVDLSITEYSSPDATSFVTGTMPLLIGPAEFVHPQGGTGYETGRSFLDAGRAFQLWVRSPDERPSAASLEQANEFLASFRARPGDFYPGRVDPATFAPADGWHTGSSGPAEIEPDGQQTMSWASTIPYRDSGPQFPPNETLAALGSDGVLIVAWLQQYGGEHAPLGGPPFRLEDFADGSFEGVPPGNASRMLRVGTPGFDATLWLFFGRDHPTPEQLVRAQAELDRLHLPAWPAWDAVTSAER